MHVVSYKECGNLKEYVWLDGALVPRELAHEVSQLRHELRNLLQQVVSDLTPHEWTPPLYLPSAPTVNVNHVP